MSNYNEIVATTKTYKRPHAVNIVNELDKAPVINFIEEVVVTSASFDTIHKVVGGLSVEFVPDRVINILDPVNDTPLNKTLTFYDVYCALYSLYRDSANARDIAALAAITPVVVPEQVTVVVDPTVVQ